MVGDMIVQYSVLALICTASVALGNPYQSSSNTLTQILSRLRNMDQDLTDIKVTVTENERRIDTRKFEN